MNVSKRQQGTGRFGSRAEARIGIIATRRCRCCCATHILDLVVERNDVHRTRVDRSKSKRALRFGAGTRDRDRKRQRARDTSK